ncbi:MAG: Lrp/AsnC ligand binding domain-containing protein [Methanocellales archaeon]
MEIGFVLINVEPGKEKKVYNSLINSDEIAEVYPLFGEYDLIAKVVAPDSEKLSEVIFNLVRRIDGVKQTKTLPSARFRGRS